MNIQRIFLLCIILFIILGFIIFLIIGGVCKYQNEHDPNFAEKIKQ